MLKWLRSMIGRGRAEREFSTAHTGGDLSLPDSVKGQIEPLLFPMADMETFRRIERTRRWGRAERRGPHRTSTHERRGPPARPNGRRRPSAARSPDS